MTPKPEFLSLHTSGLLLFFIRALYLNQNKFRNIMYILIHFGDLLEKKMFKSLSYVFLSLKKA